MRRPGTSSAGSNDAVRTMALLTPSIGTGSTPSHPPPKVQVSGICKHPRTAKDVRWLLYLLL